MKRLTCTLAALAMLIWTCIPAQAEFMGTLQRDQPWTLSIDNSGNTAAGAVTIFYLGGKNVDFDIHTLPAAESFNLLDMRIPRGTRRIIIELDPGLGLSTPVLIIQGPTAFTHPGSASRLVIDVV